MHAPQGSPAAPPRRLADYELVEAVDDGSPNVLYRAPAPPRLGLPPGATVVVKLLAGTTERAFSRLSKLLQTFASVDSPHLVPLLDGGQVDDVFFYTTADWPGGSLARPAGPLDAPKAAAALAHACLGAHALHEAGIAHRDISPSAVLLHGGGGWLGGLDLARAATAGGSVTSMAALSGVGYLDPAFIRGDSPSRATDIYALGATLHFALTGEGVHPNLPIDDAVLAVRRVLREPPHVSPSLGEDARLVIGACLDPDPAARPATAAELAVLVSALPLGEGH